MLGTTPISGYIKMPSSCVKTENFVIKKKKSEVACIWQFVGDNFAVCLKYLSCISVRILALCSNKPHLGGHPPGAKNPDLSLSNWRVGET